MAVRFASVLLLLSFSFLACDSAPPKDDDTPPPTGPAGTFVMDRVSFELHVVADENQGFYANYQGTVEGELTMSESGGVLNGSGTCSWTKRLHRSWLGETNTESGSQRFTARGTLNGDRITLDFQGCAWAMARHTGTFDGTTYRLRIPDPLSGPLYGPEVWDGSLQLSGTDPLVLTLSRK